MSLKMFMNRYSKVLNICKSAANKRKSALAWKTVNKIRGRKLTFKSKLKAASQAKRL